MHEHTESDPPPPYELTYTFGRIASLGLSAVKKLYSQEYKLHAYVLQQQLLIPNHVTYN